MKDKLLEKYIKKEQMRQDNHVELIASENFVSKDVLEAMGSILTNKYAEGYPNKRYYGGCENVDAIEQLAIDRVNKMFGSKYANVQPHSGSQANFAVYTALLEPGDVILGMDLSAGGHLTHGYKVSASGKYFKSYSYGVDKEKMEINFDEVRKIANEVKPKLIICGASAYPRIINWKKFKEIANEVGALVMADIAHIAGLVVAGEHPNPLDYNVDVVTSTTHKTLRGARGGIILTNNEEIAIKIDKAVFPGTQGGPLMNIIAGKAASFGEALNPDFIEYQKQIVKNSKAFAQVFLDKGGKLTTGGTDNHLFLIDVKTTFKINGQRAEDLLKLSNIICNKNSIPFDDERPTITSGIRLGTPAMTTKGWKEDKFIKLGNIIWNILENNSDKNAISKVNDVINLIEE